MSRQLGGGTIYSNTGPIRISHSFYSSSLTRSFFGNPAAAPDAPPDFTAVAKPVLKSHLGRWADQPGGPLSESLEIAISSWLSDLSNDIREPDMDSDPEQMLVRSGLLDKIKGGLVRTQVAA